MSEVKPEAAKPEEAGDVKAEVQPQKSEGIRYTETIEEAKAKIAETKATENLPEELQGIDKASLDKYYKEGVFNWEAYGKEQAFKARQQATKTEEAKPEEAKAEEVKTEETDADKLDKVKEVTDKAGVDWDAAANAIIEKGELSAEDRKKLTDIGIPEIVIDDYVRMIHKEAGETIAKVMEAMGGEQRFTDVFDGLQTNATTEQRDMIDTLLKDPETFETGIEMALRLSKVPETHRNAPVVGGRNQAAPSQPDVKGFASFDEQMQAQRDPRYKNDPAYRAEVMQRIMVSDYSINPRAHTSGL